MWGTGFVRLKEKLQAWYFNELKTVNITDLPWTGVLVAQSDPEAVLVRSRHVSGISCTI